MAESVKVTVRIPEDLADMIGREFVDTELFSSKADFIAIAIRVYYENSARLFVEIGQNSSINEKLNLDYLGNLTPRALIQSILINPDYLDRISQFNGVKKGILLRLPGALVEGYEKFIEESRFYRSKADFFDTAIGAYLDSQYRLRDAISKIHDNIHER